MRTITRLGAGAERLAPYFEQIRADADVVTATPEAAHTEARESDRESDPPHIVDARGDATDLPVITVDPPGSKDLDQALHIERVATGHRLYYAIADVAAHVTPGGAIDTLAHERGVTVYSPDTRIGLHPPVMSEGHASLLAGQRTKAVLWTLDIAAGGDIGDIGVERVWVRSRAQRAYGELADSSDAADRGLRALLREVGDSRRLAIRAQGGVSLPKPEQSVHLRNGAYELVSELGLPLEDDNAQLSLATGMAGARLMLDHGVGVLRTMPAADDQALRRLRRTALALGVRWEAQQTYADVLENLDHGTAATAAFLDAATTLFRGAAWSPFGVPGAEEAEGPEEARAWVHGALGAPYAHVTAPLRRLVDRFGAEAALAAAARRPVPDWAVAGMVAAAQATAVGSSRAGRVDRASVDAVESAVLHGREGQEFAAMGLDERTVHLVSPAVEARCAGDVVVGELQQVRLVSADVPEPPEFEVAAG